MRVPVIIIPFILLVLITSPAYAKNQDEKGDELTKEINTTTSNYLRSFTLAQRGDFDAATKTNFRILFSEDAKHYFFIPGTPFYLSNVGLETYMDQMREVFEEYSLQARYHTPTFVIDTIVYMPEQNLHEAIVYLSSDIILYSKLDFSSDTTFTVDLLLTIHAMEQDGEVSAKIANVESRDPLFYELTFIFLHINREPFGRQEIQFSYLDPVHGMKVNRKRFTDETGKVSISSVPASAKVEIALPGNHKLISDGFYTAEQWATLPPELYIETVESNWLRLIDFYQNNLKARSTLQVGFNKGIISSTPSFSPNAALTQSLENQNTDAQQQTTFYLSYSYSILQRNSYEILIGTGLTYTSFTISTSIGSLKQLFTEMTDKDQDEFDLTIIGNSVAETYEYSSAGLPLLLTYRHFLNNRYMHSLDITAAATYYFSDAFALDYDLRQTSRGYYPKYGLNFVDIPAYGFITDSQVNDTKELVNHEPFSFGIQLSGNIPLFNPSIMLQPSVFYDHMRISGSGELHDPELNNGEDTYKYAPAIGSDGFNLSSLRLGIGIIYVP